MRSANTASGTPIVLETAKGELNRTDTASPRRGEGGDEAQTPAGILRSPPQSTTAAAGDRFNLSGLCIANADDLIPISAAFSVTEDPRVDFALVAELGKLSDDDVEKMERDRLVETMKKVLVMARGMQKYKL